MTAKQPKYPMEEFARRGDAIYNEQIRPSVEQGNAGKYVLIDIDSGDWEMDADELAAADRLDARRPDAQVWMVRVGWPTALRFGAGRRIPSL